MLKKKIKINAKYGFHIRPAALFVKKAKQFKSEILIKFDGKEANGKSLFNLQTLGISKGSIITIIINGTDEKKACTSLEKILINLN
ncbi:HPr family phosphocarrier protein [Buchnera aphidicola]|uniref:HPr family phosphocarrier protein n=1 Tax=Buchnera aphidicola TaxID=9 RepID=UPI0030EE70EC